VIRRIRDFFDRYWPLSAFGTINAAFASTLWSWAAAVDNRAGQAIAAFVLAVVAVSAVLTRAVSSSSAERLSWGLGETLGSGENARALAVSLDGNGTRVPFVRLHARVTGSLSCGEVRLYRLFFDIRPARDGSVDVPLDIPASGELRMRCRVFARDALGLARKPLSLPRSLTVPVLPRASEARTVVHSSAVSNASREFARKQSDSERIFVREYAPGDLARDVDWKALARTGSLLTRVPPQSPKDDRYVRLIVVPPALCGDTLARSRALIQFDHVRALAASFLRDVRVACADVGFLVRVGEREVVVEPTQSFAEALSAIAVANFRVPGADLDLSDEDLDFGWFVGAESDVDFTGLLAARPSLSGGCVLSRFGGAGARHRLPIFSPGPRFFPSIPLFLAIPAMGVPFRFGASLGDRVPRTGSSGVAGARVFSCGVRL